jgi:hypothetical protein
MTGADQLYREWYGTHKLEVEMTGANQLHIPWIVWYSQVGGRDDWR